MKLITKGEGQGRNLQGQSRISKESGAKVDSKIARNPSTKINAKVSEHSITKMDLKFSEQSGCDQEASSGAHTHPRGDDRRLQH